MKRWWSILAVEMSEVQNFLKQANLTVRFRSSRVRALGPHFRLFELKTMKQLSLLNLVLLLLAAGRP